MGGHGTSTEAAASDAATGGEEGGSGEGKGASSKAQRKAQRKAARRARQQEREPAAVWRRCTGPVLRVVSVARAEGFHATSGARYRRYVYLLPKRRCGQDAPELRGDLAECPDVDAGAIDRVLQPLVGQPLDFTAFARQNGRQPGETSICTLHRCRAASAVLPDGTDVVLIEVVGDRFLRQMVRVLVATAAREASKALESGEGGAGDAEALLRCARLPSAEPGLSVAEVRDSTAAPAPAAGLCFASVGY